MNMQSSDFLQNEVKTLSRRLRATYLIFGVILLAQCVLFFGTNTFADSEIADSSDKIIKTRGIIVVDEQGRERVLIGAPIPQAKNRVFTDKTKALAAWKDKIPEKAAQQYWDNFDKLQKASIGMLVLDENGFDRVVIGDQLPDANTGKRIGSATGITIHSDKGFERAGFGTIKVGDKFQVGLGMDAEYGEALNLFASKELGVGLRINDSKNQLIFGSLEPNRLGNKSDQPFSGYMFSQGNEVKYQLNALEKK
ncbi:MAG TPA: hypothetical protein VF556_06625 [Pyrinomonadaceae bacterium]|jgi:hypothetical protein